MFVNTVFHLSYIAMPKTKSWSRLGSIENSTSLRRVNKQNGSKLMVKLANSFGAHQHWPQWQVKWSSLCFLGKALPFIFLQNQANHLGTWVAYDAWSVSNENFLRFFFFLCLLTWYLVSIGMLLKISRVRFVTRLSRVESAHMCGRVTIYECIGND